jgi:hypothetical protein
VDRHLPAYSLLLLGSPIPPGGGRIVPVPTGGVSQGVPDGVDTFLARYFDQTGDAIALYLL